MVCQRLQRMLDNAVEQLLFAAEVGVDHALVDLCPFGDAVDSGACEAVLCELGVGSGEQLVPRQLRDFVVMASREVSS